MKMVYTRRRDRVLAFFSRKRRRRLQALNVMLGADTAAMERDLAHVQTQLLLFGNAFVKRRPA